MKINKTLLPTTLDLAIRVNAIEHARNGEIDDLGCGNVIKIIFRDTTRLLSGMAVNVLALFIVLVANTAHAQSSITLPADCSTVVDAESGQIEEIKIVCKPAEWNGILVVYAHGFVPPGEGIQIPDDTIVVAQLLLPELLANGFGFAATSYRKNGYAVEQAEKDINALVNNYPGNPNRVLLVGGSEGALIITALIEKYRNRYDGGLALCGPLAGTDYAVQYFGDFRVIFDYLFPTHPGDGLPVFFTDVDNPVESIFGVIPPNKGNQFWEANWKSGIDYKGRIKETILDDLNNNNGERTKQLFNVVRVSMPDPGDPEDPDIVAEAVSDILSYNIREFNDLGETAGGDPYGNKRRWYWGSDNDWILNFRVERVSPDRSARAYVREYYTPMGKPSVPLVAIHTLRDEIVPFRNEVIYALKTLFNGSADKLRSIPVDRFGHCEFEPQEALGAFGLLLSQVGIPLPNEFEVNRALLPVAR